MTLPIPASLLILCGGHSARMGTDKARLPLLGRTLLDIQREKADTLGIGEALVCGGASADVADVYPGLGPLSGLHAGLLAARNDQCLVLPVDLPLFPAEGLLELMRVHTALSARVTLAAHNGRSEPLVGVYEKALGPAMGAFLAAGGGSVRRFLAPYAAQTVTLALPETAYLNCNTPEDYRTLLRAATKP